MSDINVATLPEITPASQDFVLIAQVDGTFAKAKVENLPNSGTIPTLPTPTSFTVAPVSGTELLISWSPGAGSPSGVIYELDYSPNGTSGWTNAYTGTGLSFNDGGFTSGETAYYRVRAVKAGYNNSSYTTANGTTSGAGLTPLSTPTLTATVISSTEIDLSWTNVANESSYRLEWSPNGTSGWTQIGGTIAANTVTYNHTSLTPSTAYYYRVKAVGDGVTYSDSGYGTANGTTSGSSYDTDAQAFFTAAGITDATQKNAVNTFVLALKSASIWTKMNAIYPFVGGTATTHKFNLVNPADTDGAFRLTFTGTWTHDANGITGDGATTYANTHYKHNTNLASKASFHISLYSRTNTNPAGEYDIDDQSSGQMRIGLICKLSGSAYSFNGGTITPTVTTSQRLFVNTRQSSVVHKLFQDGTQAGSTDTADITSSTANQYDLYLGASFANGAQSGSTFTNRNYSFMSLGDGLSDADVTALTNAVNTLQTSLSRNV